MNTEPTDSLHSDTIITNDELQEAQDAADFSIFPTLDDRKAVLGRLKLLGITSLEVTFSGGGDSGEVNGVYPTCMDGKKVDLKQEMIDGWEIESNWMRDTGWDRQLKRKRMSMDELLTNMTYDALQKSEHDWYNNDGGQGSLTIDFAESPPEIKINIGINHVETDDHEYDL